MKYESEVLICEIMGFVRIFSKEQHPRGLLEFRDKLSLRDYPSYAQMTP